MVTLILAIIGTCTGLASLLWNIYTKLSAGPKLRIQAWAGMVQRPAPPGDPKFFKVIIQNIGTQPTTLTNYGFRQYATKRDRKRGKPKFLAVIDPMMCEGARYPYKLAVGDEASLNMKHDASLDELLSKGAVYFWLQHSFSEHLVEVPVINPVFKKKDTAAHAGS